MSGVLALLSWPVLAVGSVLLLAELPWFRRTSLVQRLSPYARRSAPTTRTTAAGVSRVLLPGLDRAGRWWSRALGLPSDLAARLELAGRTEPASAFRLRQLVLGLLALFGAIAATVAVGPPPAFAITLVLGAPVLAVLATEHQLTAAGARRRALLRAELPVVVEQLGLLLAAGWSVPGAIHRLGERSDGVIAADLRRVTTRMQQGLTASAALEEWAAAVQVDAVQRLVAVLRLHDDTGDLGALVAEEANAVRAEAHRELLETIERRSQLVWVPVTVATLVPGLLFLAVPFVSAMAQVTGT